MMRALRTPGLMLIAIAAFAALAIVLTLWGAGRTPWLGLALAPAGDRVVLADAVADLPAGSTVAAIGRPGQPPMPLIALDLLAEPDSLPTYAAIDAFYARQDQLFALLAAPELQLSLVAPGGNTVTLPVRPDERPLWTLPGSFWVQVLTGLVSLIIAGSVWALRPHHLAPSPFAVSGLGVLLTTFTSALYAHRGLALPEAAYAVLMPINHLGALIFAGGLAGLFLTYPRLLIGPRWLWLIPALLVPYFLADTFRIGIEADFYYNAILAVTLAMLVLIVAQWWATRKFPVARAALGWLGLSVALGMGAFAFLSVAPHLFGFETPLSQHYAAGSLILIYAGLALGLRRYRLFELGDWAYRVLFFTVGAFLLLGLDAALVAGLNLELAPALGMSLLLVALLYMPFRDWLWRRLFARGQLEQDKLFSAAMEVAFAPSRADSAGRWRTLLGQLFDPLDTTELPDPPHRPTVHDDGLGLDLPPVAGAPGLRLAFPFGGNGLFRPRDIALATQLVALTERADESRAAYMRGVGEERRRMARDLHDDIGARLLTGLHTDETTRPTLQAALSDIRAIVSGLAGEEASLDRVLAETRHEAARRLEAADIALDWPLPETEAEAVLLDYRLHKALTSAVREIVSNVIRHSGAARLVVTPALTGDQLTLVFADNGRGLPAEALAGETPGYGLRNLRTRIEDIAGRIELSQGEPGTIVTLDVPLVLRPHTPEPGVPNPGARLTSPA